MTVDCTDDTFDQTVMIAGGANQTINGIPLGTQCTVTETSTPAPAAGYAWQTPVYTPSQTVTVNVAGGSVGVGVENPIQGSRLASDQQKPSLAISRVTRLAPPSP